jgi:FMN phosphatase YigB (HAD superfamily)
MIVFFDIDDTLINHTAAMRRATDGSSIRSLDERDFVSGECRCLRPWYDSARQEMPLSSWHCESHRWEHREVREGQWHCA